MQTVKQGLKKIKAEGENDLHTEFQRFLFRYRMVNNSSTNKTPAEVMIGRQLRSRFDLLREGPPPAYIPPDDTEFRVGDPVMAGQYNSTSNWSRGEVIKLCGKKLALVELPEGVIRRHFNQQFRVLSQFRVSSQFRVLSRSIWTYSEQCE